MAVSTRVCSLTLRNPDGSALSGADVTYRVEPLFMDDDGGGTAESGIYARRATVQTNSSGVASFTVVRPCTLYVTVPNAQIPECEVTVPDDSSALELGPLIDAQLPDLPW